MPAMRKFPACMVCGNVGEQQRVKTVKQKHAMGSGEQQETATITVNPYKHEDNNHNAIIRRSVTRENIVDCNEPSIASIT